MLQKTLRRGGKKIPRNNPTRKDPEVLTRCSRRSGAAPRPNDPPSRYALRGFSGSLAYARRSVAGVPPPHPTPLPSGLRGLSNPKKTPNQKRQFQCGGRDRSSGGTRPGKLRGRARSPGGEGRPVPPASASPHSSLPTRNRRARSLRNRNGHRRPPQAALYAAGPAPAPPPPSPLRPYLM